jgi:hypothetical protein
MREGLIVPYLPWMDPSIYGGGMIMVSWVMTQVSHHP